MPRKDSRLCEPGFIYDYAEFVKITLSTKEVKEEFKTARVRKQKATARNKKKQEEKMFKQQVWAKVCKRRALYFLYG